MSNFWGSYDSTDMRYSEEPRSESPWNRKATSVMYSRKDHNSFRPKREMSPLIPIPSSTYEDSNVFVDEDSTSFSERLTEPLENDPVNIPRAIDFIKNEGLLDLLRQDCLKEIEQKTLSRNLNQRVESLSSVLLSNERWSPRTNKSYLRERIRQRISKNRVLDNTVKQTVDSIVLPKINKEIAPKIESLFAKFLEINSDELKKLLNEDPFLKSKVNKIKDVNFNSTNSFSEPSFSSSVSSSLLLQPTFSNSSQFPQDGFTGSMLSSFHNDASSLQNSGTSLFPPGIPPVFLMKPQSSGNLMHDNYPPSSMPNNGFPFSSMQQQFSAEPNQYPVLSPLNNESLDMRECQPFRQEEELKQSDDMMDVDMDESNDSKLKSESRPSSGGTDNIENEKCVQNNLSSTNKDDNVHHSVEEPSNDEKLENEDKMTPLKDVQKQLEELTRQLMKHVKAVSTKKEDGDMKEDENLADPALIQKYLNVAKSVIEKNQGIKASDSKDSNIKVSEAETTEVVTPRSTSPLAEKRLGFQWNDPDNFSDLEVSDVSSVNTSDLSDDDFRDLLSSDDEQSEEEEGKVRTMNKSPKKQPSNLSLESGEIVDLSSIPSSTSAVSHSRKNKNRSHSRKRNDDIFSSGKKKISKKHHHELSPNKNVKVRRNDFAKMTKNSSDLLDDRKGDTDISSSDNSDSSDELLSNIATKMKKLSSPKLLARKQQLKQEKLKAKKLDRIRELQLQKKPRSPRNANFKYSQDDLYKPRTSYRNALRDERKERSSITGYSDVSSRERDIAKSDKTISPNTTSAEDMGISDGTVSKRHKQKQIVSRNSNRNESARPDRPRSRSFKNDRRKFDSDDWQQSFHQSPQVSRRRSDEMSSKEDIEEMPSYDKPYTDLSYEKNNSYSHHSDKRSQNWKRQRHESSSQMLSRSHKKSSYGTQQRTPPSPVSDEFSNSPPLSAYFGKSEHSRFSNEQQLSFTHSSPYNGDGEETYRRRRSPRVRVKRLSKREYDRYNDNDQSVYRDHRKSHRFRRYNNTRKSRHRSGSWTPPAASYRSRSHEKFSPVMDDHPSSRRHVDSGNPNDYENVVRRSLRRSPLSPETGGTKREENCHRRTNRERNFAKERHSPVSREKSHPRQHSPKTNRHSPTLGELQKDIHRKQSYQKFDKERSLSGCLKTHSRTLSDEASSKATKFPTRNADSPPPSHASFKRHVVEQLGYDGSEISYSTDPTWTQLELPNVKSSKLLAKKKTAVIAPFTIAGKPTHPKQLNESAASDTKVSSSIDSTKEDNSSIIPTGHNLKQCGNVIIGRMPSKTSSTSSPAKPIAVPRSPVNCSSFDQNSEPMEMEISVTPPLPTEQQNIEEDKPVNPPLPPEIESTTLPPLPPTTISTTK